MLGAVCAATLRALRRPSTFRLTSTVHHVDRVAWQAIPIILLITFLIGGIIAQQGFFHFRKFGAEDYVVDMVGILVLREIGVLIVAIMVAGRSGSSYTAELGSMKMREEIRRTPHDGLQSGRRSHFAARRRPGDWAANIDLHWFYIGAVWRRACRVAIRWHEPGYFCSSPQGGDFHHPLQSWIDQGTIHGPDHRRRGLRRGSQSGRQR